MSKKNVHIVLKMRMIFRFAFFPKVTFPVCPDDNCEDLILDRNMPVYHTSLPIPRENLEEITNYHRDFRENHSKMNKYPKKIAKNQSEIIRDQPKIIDHHLKTIGNHPEIVVNHHNFMEYHAKMIQDHFLLTFLHVKQNIFRVSVLPGRHKTSISLSQYIIFSSLKFYFYGKQTY